MASREQPLGDQASHRSPSAANLDSGVGGSGQRERGPQALEPAVAVRRQDRGGDDETAESPIDLQRHPVDNPLDSGLGFDLDAVASIRDDRSLRTPVPAHGQQAGRAHLPAEEPPHERAGCGVLDPGANSGAARQPERDRRSLSLPVPVRTEDRRRRPQPGDPERRRRRDRAGGRAHFTSRADDIRVALNRRGRRVPGPVDRLSGSASRGHDRSRCVPHLDEPGSSGGEPAPKPDRATDQAGHQRLVELGKADSGDGLRDRAEPPVEDRAGAAREARVPMAGDRS